MAKNVRPLPFKSKSVINSTPFIHVNGGEIVQYILP